LQAPIEQSLRVLLGEVMERARQDREEAVRTLEGQLSTLRADFEASEARAEAERQSLLEQHTAALTALRDEVTAEVGQAVLAEARQMAFEERAATEEQVRAQCLIEREAGEQELTARFAAERETVEQELRARMAAEQEAAAEELRARMAAEQDAAAEELRARLAAEHEAALQALRDQLTREHEQQMLEVEEAHQRSLAQLHAEEAAGREAAEQALRAQLMSEREAWEQALRAQLAAERETAEQSLRQSLASDYDERLEETRVQQNAPGEERLAAGLRQIDKAVSLTDALGALLDQAAAWSGRAALFLAAGERVRGWRQAGFDGDVSGIDLPLEAAGPLGVAVQTGDAAAGECRTGESSLPSWLLPSAGQAAVAVPVGVGGRPVAVLYCDGRQSPSIEILARYAARCLEVLTISRASAQPRPVSVPPPAEDVRRSETGPESDSVRQEESARRYARLLISELKLYNESAVEEGRRNRDLLARLGPEVERARRLYEEKIPAVVRERAGWFDEELVRTLAGGDASMLGQVT